jgi:hypothetical protein
MSQMELSGLLYAFNDFATGKESQQSSWTEGQVDTKITTGY